MLIGRFISPNRDRPNPEMQVVNIWLRPVTCGRQIGSGSASRPSVRPSIFAGTGRIKPQLIVSWRWAGRRISLCFFGAKLQMIRQLLRRRRPAPRHPGSLRRRRRHRRRVVDRSCLVFARRSVNVSQRASVRCAVRQLNVYQCKHFWAISKCDNEKKKKPNPSSEVPQSRSLTDAFNTNGTS